MAFINVYYNSRKGLTKEKTNFDNVNVHGVQKLFIANNPIIQDMIKKQSSNNKNTKRM